MSDSVAGIGIFGGTFNPIHIGHLRTAVELCTALNLREMRLIPSGTPPHRTQPQVSAEHRLTMLQLALGHDSTFDEPKLIADDRELCRRGPSYTFDTLVQLRSEIGAYTPLYLCIGMDSLINLNQWHRWRELANIAHIVVAARPGWQLPKSGEVIDFFYTNLKQTNLNLLQQIPSGKIIIVKTTLLPISATSIRQALQQKKSIRYLVPDTVIDYITRHQLYTDNKNKLTQEAL